MSTSNPMRLAAAGGGLSLAGAVVAGVVVLSAAPATGHGFAGEVLLAMLAAGGTFVAGWFLTILASMWVAAP